MIRAFLSHSSADKGRHIKIVADRLGESYCVYDEYTFEAGMKPLEEILRGLDSSQIFVVFISDSALKSEWVQRELLEAHTRLEEGLLSRVFPILIDKDILHTDPRIPQWMRDQYNLKYVSRPTVSARRIRQRLMELSWERHPRLASRKGLFVGRNELLRILEERLDDYSKPLPNCIIASGIPRVGRATLLRNALVKGSIVRPSYEYPSIVMRRGESIEDLILKLYDLGFSEKPYPTDLMNIELSARIEVAIGIVRDIQSVKETILVHDEGCLVNYTRDLQPWFDRICQGTQGSQITFLLSSRYRVFPENIRRKDYIFSVEVPELSFAERRGLLKRLLDLQGLGIAQEDFIFFAELQYGLPDQVVFTCDLIEDRGTEGAKKQSFQIAEYNSNFASIILSNYAGRQEELDFLYLLSEFEFISLPFLYSLVPQEKYDTLVQEFIASAVCDFVGVEKEFIRLNDVIRDFVRRNRIEIPSQFREKLQDHLDKFLSEPATEDRDISDVTYSIRQAIKAGRAAPEQYLIPSHFLNSIKELYQERGHLDRVIQLCDMLLAKPQLLEDTVAADIRYYLCLSLARKRDRRLVQEVQHIYGPEHDFLLGFYYRLLGKADAAIDRLIKVADDPVVSARARSELVQVYLSIEEFEAAAKLAEANYEGNKKNAYHVQAYFESLVKGRHAKDHRATLLRLLGELDRIGSSISQQMAYIARAEFAYRCDGNYESALEILQVASTQYPSSHYPHLVKGYLAAKKGDVETLRAAYDTLEEMSVDRTFSENSLVRLKALLLWLSGELEKAVSYARANLQGCPNQARESFIARLRATPPN